VKGRGERISSITNEGGLCGRIVSSLVKHISPERLQFGTIGSALKQQRFSLQKREYKGLLPELNMRHAYLCPRYEQSDAALRTNGTGASI
jgi:hypothetical protein